MAPEFECDLDPGTGWPRIRFNFANGWSASLVIRTKLGGGFDAMTATVAACPTGEWGTGRTILGPTEATADCAIAWLENLRADPTSIESDIRWPTEPRQA